MASSWQVTPGDSVYLDVSRQVELRSKFHELGVSEDTAAELIISAWVVLSLVYTDEAKDSHDFYVEILPTTYPALKDPVVLHHEFLQPPMPSNSDFE